MASRKRVDEGLPVAVSTQGGLLAALLVLLFGTIEGMRAWIVLIRAAMAFLLVAGIWKLLTASALQAVRWEATHREEGASESEETHDDLIPLSPETTE